jgi:putative SOS response-associated peptidase YedK
MENVRYRDLFFFPLHNLAITKKLPIVFKWTNKSIRLVIMLWWLKPRWESEILDWTHLRLNIGK